MVVLVAGAARIPPLSKGGFLQAKTGGPNGPWPRLRLGGNGGEGRYCLRVYCWKLGRLAARERMWAQ